MTRNLPSPVALRAFEAAARHLSFTRAAKELFVTQSAVSHQVKALEKELGTRLFIRLTRQLHLTKAGVSLLAVLRDSYDRIEKTVDDVRTGSTAGPLNVSLTSYFAARWLTRRMGKFSALHPEIELRLHLTNTPVDFDRMDIDLAIAWRYDDWPNLSSELLVPTRLIAVCSPALIKKGPPIHEFVDLARHTFLQEYNQKLWSDWLQAVGADDIVQKSSVTMDDPNVVHQAAVDGQGVSLGVESLLEDEISQGRLVRLFDRSVDMGGGYYLVHPLGAQERPNVSAFCKWLTFEAHATKPISTQIKN